MSKNLHQVFLANPASSMNATDEMYLIRSPFGVGDDMGITWANILASIAAQASGTWGISISGNAATATTATTATSATNATNATNIGTTAVSTNATFYPTFVSSIAGGNQAADINAALNYNPSTGTLSATTFSGAFSGTVTNALNVATTQVSTNANYFPLFVASSTNGNQPCDLGTGITFNPSTNTLTTTTFVGALTGNASTATSATSATNATNVGTTAVSTNATFYPLFVSSVAGGNFPCDVNSALNYNPSTGTLSATTFSGAFSGTVTNATNVATTQVSTNASFFPLFVASSTNGNQPCDLGTGITFNPSTNTLTTTTFSGALSGNATTATTATNATNVATTQVSTNASFFPLFVASSTNGNQACDLGTGITFNPSTNTLTTTTFSGALSGNATTATTATTANALASGAIFMTTVNQATSSATLAVNTQYITNNGASLVTYTIPATAAQGSIFRVIGSSSGGWKVNVASGQTLHLGSSATTASTGSIASTNQYDTIEFVCTVANTEFVCRPPQGTLTVV